MAIEHKRNTRIHFHGPYRISTINYVSYAAIKIIIICFELEAECMAEIKVSIEFNKISHLGPLTYIVKIVNNSGKYCVKTLDVFFIEMIKKITKWYKIYTLNYIR